MYKCLFIFWLLLGLAVAAKAQQPDTVAVKNKKDSLQRVKDSVTSKRYYPKITKEKTYHPDSLHDPHKAVMRSLMIPGWGQIYNHRWWKVPLIYGGLGLLGDVVVFNQKYYKIFLNEALLREKGIVGTSQNNPLLVNVSNDDVVTYTNSYRRDRDLGILGFLGGWGIQMIDAYIDAKFIRSYTMDNNLSFKISPGTIGQPSYALNNNTAFIPAVKITFTLK
ncbi:MAG: hypothetical protein JST50_08540 [Bacteroidetes bacterium]|jgi:signal peptidase I|nr:hypothetical protein [Bacteroidota bacterium]